MTQFTRVLSSSGRIFRRSDFGVLLLALSSAGIAFGCGSSSTTVAGVGGGASVGGSNSTGGAGVGGQANTGGAPVGAGGAATGGSPVSTGGAATGGNANPATGGNPGNPAGGAATGGANAATGGRITTGTGTGGNPAGGAATGGANAATGGKTTTTSISTGGSSTATGGKTSAGGTAANPTGGATSGVGGAGTGGSAGGGSPEGPCDIYAAASPAVPCVAAYSSTRVLSSKYTGPLYRLRKGGSWSASAGMTGGTTQDINAVGGYADAASQDTFCSGGTCTFETIYDQSGKANHLKVAPKGCYTGTASEPDSEASATKKSTTLNGHKVYAVYMVAHDGYRNNATSGVPVGNVGQGIYEVADGTRIGAACCFDFGNAAPNNCNGGTMTALFFGTGYWGKGSGSGPWFLGDFEGGVWAGGTGASTATIAANPSMAVPFAFGILKSGPGNYAIRAANAQSGSITTAWDGAQPKTLNNQGAVILGIGGDNSNSSLGTFFEGVVTNGRPTDATDAAVLANIQAAGYGK
jgi:non-reducing end alpha-L-arabinofuranosidase